MNLHDNQLRLIRHLIRFNTLDYLSCLEALDTNNTGDRVALSYAFRPLTKNNYIVKDKNGIVSVLKKGRDILPSERRLISEGSNTTAKRRVLQVSRVAALMEKNDVIIIGELPENELPHFIPSACWRNIAQGVLSTTRFAGILLAYGRKYAVYDIGDGKMEWQLRAESSLFYTKYGSYETKADGMILICDNGMRQKIAENIIRQTMWNRRTLLEEHYTERNRPVNFSRSPIKLRTQYERVYLIERGNIRGGLNWIYKDEESINNTADGSRINDAKLGDKRVVVIKINEPLPALKELTEAVELHWVNLIHEAIAVESKTGIPKFNKAFVLIEITTPKGTKNTKVWDTSNRAINVIINNLKGIFFDDDNFEHMACGIVADWGGIGETIIRVCELDDLLGCAVFGAKT